MASKTKINQRMRAKTNPDLAEAIYLAKKNNLAEIAGAISIPTRQQARVNLAEIEKAKESSIIVPGKVLSGGQIKRKVKIYAIGFSAAAKEKLKKAGCEVKTILQGLKENKKLGGEILK